MDPQPPTLVLVGEQDAPFLASAQRMAGVLPKSTLAVIPDAGHSPQFENPDAWWQTVSSFLESISEPVAGRNPEGDRGRARPSPSDGIPAIWSALVGSEDISPGPLTDDDEQSPAPGTPRRVCSP